jgi:arginase family enzyme
MEKTKIVKVPGINGLNKTSGCENTPDLIFEELKNIYTTEGGKEINVSELDVSEIEIDTSDIEEMSKKIYEDSLEIFNDSDENQKTIFLGGDHSVSYGIGKAFLGSVNNLEEKKQPCLIVFDAHPDLMKPMKEPTHEEWLRGLIEFGFPSENILIIGLRNSDKSELEFIQKNNIRTMPIARFLEDIENALDTITEFAYNKETYVSLDIDVLDPVFAPATGYLVSGGLSSRQLIYAIQRINKIKNLRVIDIVEINSEKDKKFDMITTKLGAKILSEFL